MNSSGSVDVFIDKTKDRYKSYKNNFKNICTNTEFVNIIEDMSKRTNIIIMNTYSFLFSYFCHLFKKKKQFPIIDAQFLRHIITLVSSIKSNRKCKEEFDDLVKYNDDIYSN